MQNPHAEYTENQVIKFKVRRSNLQKGLQIKMYQSAFSKRCTFILIDKTEVAKTAVKHCTNELEQLY